LAELTKIIKFEIHFSPMLFNENMPYFMNTHNTIST
jgi:hypothetical protein